MYIAPFQVCGRVLTEFIEPGGEGLLEISHSAVFYLSSGLIHAKGPA